MATLKVGIASYEDMKARTMAVARGDHRVAPDESMAWFTSTESFARVLSAGNRDLLRVIVEQAPVSLDELVRMTGKAKSNLSRTLKTMADYGRPAGTRRAPTDHAEGRARPGGTRPAAHSPAASIAMPPDVNSRLLAKALPEPDFKYRSRDRAVISSFTAT